MFYKTKKRAFSLTEALVSLIILGIIVYMGTSIITTKLKYKQRNLICAQGGYMLVTNQSTTTNLTLDNIEKVKITIIGNGGKGGDSVPWRYESTSTSYDYSIYGGTAASNPDKYLIGTGLWGVLGADGGHRGETEVIDEFLTFQKTNYSVHFNADNTIEVKKNGTSLKKVYAGGGGVRGNGVYKREVEATSGFTPYTTKKGAFLSYGLGETSKALLGNFGNGGDGTYRDLPYCVPPGETNLSKYLWEPTRHYSESLRGSYVCKYPENQTTFKKTRNDGLKGAVLFEWPTSCIVK